MANSLAMDIVQTALSLRAERPTAAALEIFDLAMLGRTDSDPVFDRSQEGPTSRNCIGMSVEEILALRAADDLADPSGKFGQLLGQAFLGTRAVVDDWDIEVMYEFGQRYNLWSKRVHLPPAAWKVRCLVALMDRAPDSAESALPAATDDCQMDDVDIAECLEMLAASLYESPLVDGLSPETAAHDWSQILRR